VPGTIIATLMIQPSGLMDDLEIFLEFSIYPDLKEGYNHCG
jgi:hypothetical protein